MGDEAQLMIGAGLETTAWAFTTTNYHLISNPLMLKKLRAELEEQIPDPTATVDLVDLERLPYLSACIQEGIRLSYGVSSRSLPHLSG